MEVWVVRVLERIGIVFGVLLVLFGCLLVISLCIVIWVLSRYRNTDAEPFPEYLV